MTERSKLYKFGSEQTEMEMDGIPSYWDQMYKLAIFSKCRCGCLHWKSSGNQVNGADEEMELSDRFESLTEKCGNCRHDLKQHLLPYRNADDQRINEAVSWMEDHKSLMYAVQQSEGRVKSSYFCLSKLLKTCICFNRQPKLPVEKLGAPHPTGPNILQTIENLLRFKFGHLPPDEAGYIRKCASCLFGLIDNAELESSDSVSWASAEAKHSYEVVFAKWVCYCLAPRVTKCFPLYYFKEVFGGDVLKMVFPRIRLQMLDQMSLASEGKPSSNHQTMLTFISALEETISSDSAMATINSSTPSLSFTQFAMMREATPSTSLMSVDSSAQSSTPSVASVESVLSVNSLSSSSPSPSTFTNMETTVAPPFSAAGVDEKAISSTPRPPLVNFSSERSVAGLKNVLEEVKSVEKVTSCMRDEAARQEERRGDIEFHVISNFKGVSKKLKGWLLQARNLFLYELPGTSEQFITRLVFDPNYRTFTLIKKDRVLGAICFRVFPNRHFSELVFCAIRCSDQLKGYGTHLLNHLKEWHIVQKILCLLVQVEEGGAVGFFRVHGFSTNIKLDHAVYEGYLQSHTEATTLLFCELNPRIPYTQFSAILAKQQQTVGRLCDIKREAHVAALGQLVKNEASLGGGSSAAEDITAPDDDDGSLDSYLKAVMVILKSHRRSKPFHADVPHSRKFYETVKAPMFFETVEKKIDEGGYGNVEEFVKDVKTIFHTFKKFYRSGSPVHMCAVDVEDHFTRMMAVFKHS